MSLIDLFEELDDLNIDEEFIEWERKHFCIGYPAISTWRGGTKRGKLFSISSEAKKYFTAEAYKIRVSENYIVFVPASRAETNAYVLRRYFDKAKQFESYSICFPNELTDVENGVHKLKRCKQGLCISRKADREE